jgi:hypothetical protein
MKKTLLRNLGLLISAVMFSAGLAEEENVQERIVSGRDAEAGEFPFFVQVSRDCGGSLLWYDVILTAGHCMPQIEEAVLIGPYRPSKTQGGAEWRNVTEKVRHPLFFSPFDRYRGNESEDPLPHYDYLVAKLERPVTAPYLQPIALNRNKSRPGYEEELMVIGFGDTEFGSGVQSDVLQKVKVNAIPHEECASQYSIADLTIDMETELGAGALTVKGGTDACKYVVDVVLYGHITHYCFSHALSAVGTRKLAVERSGMCIIYHLSFLILSDMYKEEVRYLSNGYRRRKRGARRRKRRARRVKIQLRPSSLINKVSKSQRPRVSSLDLSHLCCSLWL